jgi:pyruvate/2-oxoglutarate dehydrogenase complex dihydrolipoamide acyltransferase (E2) component
MRYDMNTEEATEQVTADLEKATSLNSQFAPAYEALSSLYSLHPENADKAIAAGKKAIQLEPGTLTYAVSYGYVLLRLGKVADAKTMATRIQDAAKTPADQSAARQLMEVVASREAYDAQVAVYARQAEEAAAKQASAAANPAGRSSSGSSSLSVEAAGPAGFAKPPVDRHAKETQYAVEGIISLADCGNGAGGKVTLTVNKSGLRFKIVKLSELQIAEGDKDVSDHPPACAEWKGRRARLYFYQLKEKEFAGELSTIQFF